MDAQDGMQSLLTQEGQMGKGAARAVSHEHILWAPRRMERRDLGHVMGVPGSREHVQQEACARMKQGEQMGHGEPTPRALPAGWAKGLLPFRRIGPRDTGPVDEAGTVPRHCPSSCVVWSHTAAVRRSHCCQTTSGNRGRA